MNQTSERPKRRGGQGRPPVPPDQKLVGNGLHMHPASKRELQELTAFNGTTQRDIIETMLSRAAAKMRRNGLYDPWVKAGRPIPFREWIDAGSPSEWNGKRLDLK